MKDMFKLVLPFNQGKLGFPRKEVEEKIYKDAVNFPFFKELKAWLKPLLQPNNLQ